MHVDNPHTYSVSKDKLEKLIENRNILSAEEWIEDIEKKKKSEKAKYCLTFDDGLKCQYDIALPLIEKHNLKGIWFPISLPLVDGIVMMEVYKRFANDYYDSIDSFYRDFFKETKIDLNTIPIHYLSEFKFYSENDRRFRYIRDRILKKDEFDSMIRCLMSNKGISPERLSSDLWMNKENIRDLDRNGHIIGLHSHTHPCDLNDKSYDEQKEEYSHNHSILSTLIKNVPFCVAHPCNSYNDDTLEILKGLNIRIGFCSNENVGGTMLEIPRLDAKYM